MMDPALLLILLGSASMAMQTTAQQAPLGKSVHTVFTTECNQYFNWQVRSMSSPFLQGQIEAQQATWHVAHARSALTQAHVRLISKY